MNARTRGHTRLGAEVEAHRQDLQAARPVVAVDPLHRRRLLATGWTPGGPEVEEYRFLGEHLGESNRLSRRILQREVGRTVAHERLDVRRLGDGGRDRRQHHRRDHDRRPRHQGTPSPRPCFGALAPRLFGLDPREAAFQSSAGAARPAAAPAARSSGTPRPNSQRRSRASLEVPLIRGESPPRYSGTKGSRRHI